MSSLNYTTKEGDRWDQLAFRFYGSVKSIGILTDANPTVSLSPVIDFGTILIVPIIDNSTASVITKNKPPWK